MLEWDWSRSLSFLLVDIVGVVPAALVGSQGQPLAGMLWQTLQY